MVHTLIALSIYVKIDIFTKLYIVKKIFEAIAIIFILFTVKQDFDTSVVFILFGSLHGRLFAIGNS